eukprot:2446867-Pyramimonas_sp.AAC.1
MLDPDAQWEGGRAHPLRWRPWGSRQSTWAWRCSLGHGGIGGLEERSRPPGQAVARGGGRPREGAPR